jgi:predicted phage terminase large subunit-like protein
LENILNDPTWITKRYEAHDDDFGSILWPGMFDEARLRAIRDSFAAHGRLDKYNMEYRNRPTDRSAALFREEDFLAMNESDHLAVKENDWPIAVGGDFAISVKTRRDYTVFVVGVFGPDGMLYIVDVIRERMGELGHESEGVVTRMFEVEDVYRNWTKGAPLQWFEEDGSIRKALGYALELEMKARNVYLNLCPQNPGTTDKRTRSMPIRGRMRAKMVKFDTQAEWFHNLQNECLEFDRGKHDDQVDALSWLGIGIASMALPQDADDLEEEEFTLRRRHVHRDGGRNQTTGY